MRVVHISTVHSPLDVRIFHKECRSLAEAGFEVHLLVNDPPAQERDGVQLRPVRRRRGLTHYPGGLLDGYRRARALDAAIYHFHDAELIPLGVALRMGGARVIYDVHEDAPNEALSLFKHRPVWGWVKSWILEAYEAVARRTLDGFVCATPHIAAKFPDERTVVVHNFPRTEEFPHEADGLPFDRRPPNVVYAGGIFRIRGTLEMVRAIDLLPDSLGARLRLLGTFSPPALHDEAERLPGWKRTDFAGWLARDQMVEELGRARAGLLLFHPERDHVHALPNKLFEYMAAGVPLIASDFPLWREIVEGTGAGVLVDPRSPEEIAAAIRFFVENPDVGAEMGARGRAAVADRYNWEREARVLTRFYRELGAS